MGIMDGLRRAVGMPTDGAETTAEMKARMSGSKDPADAFAFAVAERLVGYNQDPLARAMPEIAESGTRWSRDPDRRWADIARTARGIAETTSSRALTGLDAPMAAAVDRASFADAARTFAGRGTVSRHLDEERRGLGLRVGNALAGGAEAERLAQENARFMGGRRNMSLEEGLVRNASEHVRVPQDVDRARHMQWLLDSNRAFLAMARRGMLPDDEVVSYAKGVAGYGAPVAPVQGRIDRTGVEAADTPKVRRDLVRADVERSMDEADRVAGRQVSPPFRPLELKVVPTPAEIEAKRTADMAALPDAEWTRTGARRMTNRVEGQLVGERAGYELRGAIEGREREGAAWRARHGSMLPAGLLENAAPADLHAARAGRIEGIGDEALRLTMTDVKRDARQLHHAGRHDFGHHARHADAEAEKARMGAAARPVVEIAAPAARSAFAAARQMQAGM